MIGSILKNVTKLFGGNKSDKDLKEIGPVIAQINEFQQSYKELSNDELRSKSIEFQNRISEFLDKIDSELKEAQQRLESTPETEIDTRDALFHQIEEIDNGRNVELEKVLDEILPEAFAVVKETASRFTNNESLSATATDLDRELAIKHPHIKIEGDKVHYANEWMAAGGQIKWNMIHYDVQLIGGIALHRGRIAEMATGEGKTLVSTLPAYLNALSKRGVHLVTVNDYLARRDCEWNAPIFNFLGLTVDCLEYHQPNTAERSKAYRADITYGTNNEFGFDYLRDNMAHTPEEQVQRKHHYAMVDEVDSVLIDDARTPLIISGPTPQGEDQQYLELKPRIQRLVDEQKKYFNAVFNEAKKLLESGSNGHKEGEGGLALLRAFRALPKNKAIIKFLGEPGIRGIMTKTENHYLADQQKEMPKADAPLFFTIDEKMNSVDLTDKGVELITAGGEDPHFFIMPDVGSSMAEIEKSGQDDATKARAKEELMREFAVKSDRIHSIQQLLKAYTLFEKDTEYIIQEGKVKIVDEQTGRVMEGRRYSDGLHQAIEAKENVKVEAATQTYATITLQNYFRMYHKLCGMTGTAETEAQEFWDIYKLGVQVIPTNRAMIRKDMEDLVYKSTREKFNAVIDEIVKLSTEARPVLVGTTSVEISELLSRMLKLRGIKHNVLNAKQHQREAEIVAEAGLPGNVTIATNMAGRGTDIKISDQVKASGGLAIIGTERHESRRVDRQLRGRAGRQGDPGSSRFFVSLEDDLMRKFGAEKVGRMMDRIGYKEGDVIEHKWMTKTIERNQKRMEQMNFGIRKRLLEYDDVMNKQRSNIYTMRRNALVGDRLSIDLRNMLYNWCAEQVGAAKDMGSFEQLEFEVLKTLAYNVPFDVDTFNITNEDTLTDMLYETLTQHYQDKSERIRQQALPVFKHIRQEQGERIENIVVPMTDGIHHFQIMANMNKALETECRHMITEFEKNTTLQIVDDEWKEHLRELDELKQSVSNASLEQKDPLLIYKIESFKLFGEMLNRLNSRVLGLLFRSEIESDEVQEGRTPVRRNDPKVKAGREELGSGSPRTSGGGNHMPPQPEMERVIQTPIKNEMKVGRNDPCPCGSGKKFKACHGKEA